MKRSFSAGLLSLALVAGACGGSSTEAADSDPSATTAQTTTPTVAPTTTPAPSTTAEATTTTAVATTTTTAEVDDEVVAAYCETSAEADRQFDETDLFNPADLENMVVTQIGLIQAVEQPAQIADALDSYSEFLTAYNDILVDHDYDIQAATTSLQELNDSLDDGGAEEQIDLFEAEYCPQIIADEEFVPADNPAGLTKDDVLELLDSPAGREGMAEGLSDSSLMTLEEATCFIDETDPDVIASLFAIGTGQDELSGEATIGMVAGLDACELSLSVFG